MDSSEKNRLAKAVVERWCFFQEALGATKRKYPTQEFRSFVEATRSCIELTRHHPLIHREVAKAINGLTEFLRLERKRVPGRILYEADRLECLFFGGLTRTSKETSLPACKAPISLNRDSRPLARNRAPGLVLGNAMTQSEVPRRIKWCRPDEF